jgi:hypothetical protein
MQRPANRLLAFFTRKLGLCLWLSLALATPGWAQTCLTGPDCDGILRSLSFPTLGRRYATRLSILNTNADGEYPIQIVPDELAAKEFNVAIQGFPNPGDPNRLNQVVRFGWNLGLGGQRDNYTDGALGLEFESHYVPSPGNEFFEHHFAYVNKSNVVYRPLSWMINKNTDFIEGAIRASKFHWLSGSDNAQWMVFTPYQINLNGTTILHTLNNQQWIKQVNSAGNSFVPLLYLNKSDQVSIAPRGNVTIFGGKVGIGSSNPTSTLYVDGSFTATGSKSALVETASYGKRKLYAVESPENWFEDFGSAKLTEGQVIIELDRIFIETVNTAVPYHVFLTPNGACTPYVTQKTSLSFKVVLHDGEPDCAFDYRVVAKRKGYEQARLEVVEEAKQEAQVTEIEK